MTTESSSKRAPIVFILAPRMDTVPRVLEAIKAAQPTKLYVVADAGWSPESVAGYKQVKELIDAIDWCEVETNYATKNIGAKMRLATGISWVFEREERAIILEHDCLPDASFFQFCDELLERYKDDERVMHISGNNFFKRFGVSYECLDSYFFTNVPHIWGWATWRRAWQHYDVHVVQWPEARQRKMLNDVFRDDAVAFRWQNRLQEYYEGRIESWDGQWTFAILSQGGLSINPRVNLVTNIGFGAAALSAKDPNSPLADIPSESITFPLTHPPFIVVDARADSLIQREVFGIGRSPSQRLRWRLKKSLPRVYALLKKMAGRPSDAVLPS